MKKRTDFDFSKHTHRVEIFKSDEGNEIRVDHFQQGNKKCGYIKFVNDDNGLAVYGDFGNWVFCRPFHPSADGFVCDGYWFEKLRIGSSQVLGDYDSEATANELQKLIDGGLEEYGYSSEQLEEIKEWYTDLLAYTDDETEYAYHAYRDYNKPCNLGYEEIPFCKKVNIQLEIIFDAFDEICNRLKKL
jgi:hypothetical protein